MEQLRKNSSAARRGFTLVELFAVILVLFFLLLFVIPAIRPTCCLREKRDCGGNIRQVIQGLLMYREDWGVYPDALYGISYDGVDVQRPLYPTFIRDERTFHCPDAPNRLTDRGLVAAWNGFTSRPTPYWLMEFSSYDSQLRPQAGFTRRELRYCRHWTGRPRSIQDNPRQLIYRHPPEETVVTWCLYHAEMDDTGRPAPGGMAIVGFLSGRVQDIPAEKLIDWSDPNGAWRVSPKP
jgi:competence protein ComGC